MGSVEPGVSRATGNPDTVVVTQYVNESKDRNRPILLELTGEGALRLAERLIQAAKELPPA
ncbi:hypothetical protein [Streptomyces sp. SID3212]|uniref:hypothetical protein n=1 Tax=Streptomyces sp. SID3212 TaxID=2690259 RepID=UPI0013CB15F7|nr:hypothetical protein [Streptomyces sp. SID3212]MYV58002.1 hypothetical protein [Streptomyces sp. SID3212]